MPKTCWVDSLGCQWFIDRASYDGVRRGWTAWRTMRNGTEVTVPQVLGNHKYWDSEAGAQEQLDRFALAQKGWVRREYRGRSSSLVVQRRGQALRARAVEDR